MSDEDNDKYKNLINDKIGEFEVSSPIKPIKFTSSFFDDVKFIPVNQTEECPICYAVIDDSTGKSTTECGHTFCSKCFAQTMQASVSCPLCRKNLAVDMEQEINQIPIPFFDNYEEEAITRQIFRNVVIDTHYLQTKLRESISVNMGPRPFTQEQDKIEKIISQRILKDNSFWECFSVVSREACYGTANWFYNNLLDE